MTAAPAADDGRGPTDWVRPPAVAGLFYPDDAAELRTQVRDLLDAASSAAPEVDAVIAPHAGYRFSGETAAAAWAALDGRSSPVGRVVLAGPAHRVPVGAPGVGVSSARAWSTPLGDVALDTEAAGELVDLGLAVVADAAHAPEHSLEVHLPFLLEAAPDVPVVPLLVGGRCPPRVAAEAIGRVWDDDGTVVVVSSDLSHYLDDASARRRDAATLAAVTGGRVDDLAPDDACGRAAIAGLMVAARHRGVAPTVLATATSADSPDGDVDRVVGYAAVAYEHAPPLTDAERAWLVDRARAAVAHEVTTGQPDPLDDVDVPARLRLLGASFVTLYRGGELAGCIGSLEASRPLWIDVVRNAVASASRDRRFPPLTPDDLPTLGVKVSVLSGTDAAPADRAELAAALRPGHDGVVLDAGGRRGTFLPSVWETLPEVDRFLDALVTKAGLPAGTWPADLRAWRYTTDEFDG